MNVSIHKILYRMVMFVYFGAGGCAGWDACSCYVYVFSRVISFSYLRSSLCSLLLRH